MSASSSTGIIKNIGALKQFEVEIEGLITAQNKERLDDLNGRITKFYEQFASREVATEAAENKDFREAFLRVQGRLGHLNSLFTSGSSVPGAAAPDRVRKGEADDHDDMEPGVGPVAGGGVPQSADTSASKSDDDDDQISQPDHPALRPQLNPTISLIQPLPPAQNRQPLNFHHIAFPPAPNHQGVPVPAAPVNLPAVPIAPAAAPAMPPAQIVVHNHYNTSPWERIALVALGALLAYIYLVTVNPVVRSSF